MQVLAKNMAAKKTSLRFFRWDKPLYVTLWLRTTISIGPISGFAECEWRMLSVDDVVRWRWQRIFQISFNHRLQIIPDVSLCIYPYDFRVRDFRVTDHELHTRDDACNTCHWAIILLEEGSYLSASQTSVRKNMADFHVCWRQLVPSAQDNYHWPTAILRLK